MSGEHGSAICRAIEDAEVVLNPLENLVQLAEADPGAPFTKENLDALLQLRQEDRAHFERLRFQLKAAGCRVTALDEALAQLAGTAGGRGPNQADVLIEIAQEADLFHSPDSTAYADIRVNEHRETWPVRTKGFKRWLSRRFYETTSGAPNSEALQAALNVIEARAHFDGPEREVFIRIGGLSGKLYLDLADRAWRAVEIDSDGWRVVEEVPVRFRRAAGMKPLPNPTCDGSIVELRRFLNVRDEKDFTLAVAWALAVLRDRGPYPVLVLTGEQGSAKSTFSNVLRSLLDPNTAPLRALPREDRDLFIAASNGHVLAFDNVSGLRGWISDTLCRLATGGGFAVRQLYTDQDEVLFDAARPVILNGIEDMVTRPDLADRAIFLTLEPIPEDQRRPEKELWAEFDAIKPRLLGVLLDAVSHGLKHLPDTRLDILPRMADFALWATACETELWPAGSFGAAYSGNRNEAVDNVIEADPVGSAVRSLLTSRTEWSGTASDLLAALDGEVGEKVSRSRDWPASPRAVSGRLRRAATFLRKVGIDIAFKREGRARTRIICISRSSDNTPNKPSTPSVPSAAQSEREKNSVDSELAMRTVQATADAGPDSNRIRTVRETCSEDAELAHADGADGISQPQSGSWRGQL